MKKIIIAAAFALSAVSANACEICGCGLGNYYIGFLPQFNHKFLGLRYEYSRFHTNIANDPTQYSNDYYKSVEVWAGWNIGKRWQVLAILPYNFIHQVSDDGTSNNSGIGDIALMGNYKLFDKSSTHGTRHIAQQWWIGGGIKLPTGKFHADPADPELIAIANTQSGTASTDFMLNTMYNVRINKVGINTTASYKINTANRDKYAFGNKFSASTFAFYAINKKKTSFMPNIGLSYEHTASNQLDKESVAQTGGHLLSTTAGLEVSFKTFSVGANAQLPLNQDFANGQTNTKLKGMVHVTFSL